MYTCTLQFSDLDIHRLQTDAIHLFARPDAVHPLLKNQVGLTYMDDDCANKFHDGVGSLDWDYQSWTTGKNPPPSTRGATEADFSKIVPAIEPTYLGSVVAELQQRYNIGRTRLMKLSSTRCLSWHRDSTPRLHIPIITGPACFMIWENKTIHLEQGKLHWTDTRMLHTAINASFEDRIHLVTTVAT